MSTQTIVSADAFLAPVYSQPVPRYYRRLLMTLPQRFWGTAATALAVGFIASVAAQPAFAEAVPYAPPKPKPNFYQSCKDDSGKAYRHGYTGDFSDGEGNLVRLECYDGGWYQIDG
jgi:hypothetical protein